MAVASVTVVVVAAVSVTVVAPVDTAAMAHAVLKYFGVFNDVFCNGHHDIQHNDSRYNNIQHNIKLNTTLNIINIMEKTLTLSINDTQHNSKVSIMLSVANKPNMRLSVIMVNSVRVSVVMLSFVVSYSDYFSGCFSSFR